MKKFCVIQVFVTALLATRALAGNITVVGDLTVATNLTAQSITLGGVTETNWPGVGALPLQGHKYVVVAEGTNDDQRGGNLRSAYATATTLSPSSSNRVAVIVPPGSYNLGTNTLIMNTSCVDLIGLVPAQMTTKKVFTVNSVTYTKTVADVHCPVRIYTTSGDTVQQNVHDVHIESVILQTYAPSVSGTNTILRHVEALSMPLEIDFAGLYIDCVGGDNCFGTGDSYNYADASGTFIDCVAGANSFAGDFQEGQAFGDGANGTFIGCSAGDYSFGTGGDHYGIFIGCAGGNNSFGGEGGDVVHGTYVDCVGGSGCFGGSGTLATTAKFQHCAAGGGSFGGVNVASDDFNYNVGGANTFLMLPNLPTSTNGLPSGSVYKSSGTLKIMP